ncbi:MAG: hypothetical protein Q8N99_02580 [Nanoarchaeota archaeon]|nr:hypothetical protein [Nanoarchaeota archaeon]
MEKDFKDILRESYKEYKDNFRVYFPLILLLSIIPSLFITTGSFLISSKSLSLGDKPSFEQLQGFVTQNFYLMLLFALGIIIVIILGNLLYSSLIYNVMNKKKYMNFSDTIKGGKRFFWIYLGFVIVICLLLIGLIILLIIPAIIFGIYWIYSPFILIGEKKGIIESLKESKKLVKTRWWKTFGKVLSLALFLILAYIIFGILSIFFNFLINPDYVYNMLNNYNKDIDLFYNALYSNNMNLVSILIEDLFNMVAGLITIPISLLFIKNLYLERKNSRKS